MKCVKCGEEMELYSVREKGNYKDVRGSVKEMFYKCTCGNEYQETKK